MKRTWTGGRCLKFGFRAFEAMTILLLVAAGLGLQHHNLADVAYCTFGAIPLALVGLELVRLGFVRLLGG